MHAHESIPPGSTGKQRWLQSVEDVRQRYANKADAPRRGLELERIRSEITSIVIYATVKPKSTGFYDWAKDLRKGRTNVIGGFFRLVDVMARRQLGTVGRTYALRILALAHEYVDIALPETKAPAPADRIPAIALVRQQSAA